LKLTIKRDPANISGKSQLNILCPYTIHSYLNMQTFIVEIFFSGIFKTAQGETIYVYVYFNKFNSTLFQPNIRLMLKNIFFFLFNVFQN